MRPRAVNRRSSCRSTSLLVLVWSVLGVLALLACVMAPPCFNLKFLNDMRSRASSCLHTYHSVYLLWWGRCSVFCPFYNRVVCFLIVEFKGSLYILDTSCLSDMCFANIFLPVCACISFTLTVSFAKSHISLFSFSWFWCCMKKLIAKPKVP